MDIATGCCVTPSQTQPEENPEESPEEDYKSLFNECNRKLAELTEQFQKRLFNITTEYDVLKLDHQELTQYVENVEHIKEKSVNEKDTVLQQHNPTTPYESPCTNHATVHLKKTGSNADIFRIKSKKKGSSKSVYMELSNCEYPDGDQENVDTVKCNICDKWVCELCNDVPVLKLKPGL